MENKRNSLLGQDRELNILTNYLVNKNTPNSLILIGEKGISLKDTAKKMALSLVNNDIKNNPDEIKRSLIAENDQNSPFILLIEKIWLDDKKRFKNKIYREDLNYINDFFSTRDEAVKIIAGSARSMGIEVKE